VNENNDDDHEEEEKEDKMELQNKGTAVSGRV
jgi:hypothetical protein